MKTEWDFFIVHRDLLKGKKNFPFQIYVWNPGPKKYSLFLNGNQPLTKDHENFLDYLLERGGMIAIPKNQKRTFLSAQELEASDVPLLKEREEHPLEKERLINIKLKEMHDAKKGNFSLQNEFKKSYEADNFEPLITQARMEILTFSVTSSPTVSLAIHLAKTHLEKDTFINRVVALSYLLAKNNNVNEQDSLADLICGAYLSHLGLSQIPLTLARKPYTSLFEKDKSAFQKHTILGHHLLKKSKIDISDRCKRIVLEHHERSTGTGYPTNKSHEQIDSLALLLGVVAHLLEYSSGKINGEKRSIKSVLHAMKSKNYLPGLEFDFEEKIFQSIITLINDDNLEKRNDDQRAA